MATLPEILQGRGYLMTSTLGIVLKKGIIA